MEEKKGGGGVKRSGAGIRIFTGAPRKGKKKFEKA